MSRYITEVGPIFICPRCTRKRPMSQMVEDPNTRVKVCNQGCQDLYDPYRLPQRRTEDIALQYPRPDESIST